ncbi:MAG: hypothetical protein LBQ40_06050 [Clostridiales bacterium]|jgi:hypothetical protein|nr:hypothetical protein [Clostridiales bacterium]
MSCIYCGRKTGAAETFCRYCGAVQRYRRAEEISDSDAANFARGYKPADGFDGASEGGQGFGRAVKPEPVWNSFTQFKNVSKGDPESALYQPLLGYKSPRFKRKGYYPAVAVYDGTAAISIFLSMLAVVAAALSLLGLPYFFAAGFGLSLSVFVASAIERRKNLEYRYIGLAFALLAVMLSAVGLVLSFIA